MLGKIPADRLYPLGLNILKMYPLPNSQSTTIGTNHQFIQPTYDTLLYQPALRLDYQVTPGLRVSFKYQGNNRREARGRCTLCPDGTTRSRRFRKRAPKR